MCSDLVCVPATGACVPGVYQHVYQVKNSKMSVNMGAVECVPCVPGVFELKYDLKNKTVFSICLSNKLKKLVHMVHMVHIGLSA